MPIDSIHANFNSFLDVFDEPVRKFLEDQVRTLGYDPHELLPVIKIAIEEAKKLVLKELKKVFLPLPILKGRIEEHAYTYIIGVLSQSKKWRSARDRIKSYRSVFLVGAGISFESGMPLTKYLSDLLCFCEAKDYDELRRDMQKCLKFKLEFKKICDDKSVSESHKLIAQNFPEYILEIICLNWDNLIEKAARKLGKEIPKVNEDSPVTGERYLWKFHGDVEKITKDNVKGKGGWVFPDEAGYVFNCFISYIERTGLKDKLFTFVIVGYSEREENIYKNIIERFEKVPPRPTYRIGLDLRNLKREDYIVGPADFVLKKILPSA